MSYKAMIFFDATEDIYEHGEQPDSPGASWEETLTAKTKKELKEKIAEVTFNDWKFIEQDDINEYEHATEYWTSYLTTDDNDGKASDSEVALWKQGKLRLWAVHCHILVNEVTKKKVTL